MPTLHSQAPDFTLHHSKTDAVTLSDLRGQKVVLAFFPAAFTGVCEKELCTFRDSLADLNALNATVLGICVDGPFANMAFAAKNDLNFPILSDYSREVTRAYDVALDDFAGLAGYTVSKRAVFIVDEEGTVSYEWIGAHPGLEPNYAEVQAALA
jgi:glutaredoxin-dependent peroxiredoxin